MFKKVPLLRTWKIHSRLMMRLNYGDILDIVGSWVFELEPKC